MQTLAVFALMTASLSSMAASVAFPDSLPARVIESRYGPQLMRMSESINVPLDLAIYSVSELGVDEPTVSVDQLLVAPPAMVTTLIRNGLIPVGFHDGYTDIQLIQLDNTRTADCFVHLPPTSTMGWLEPVLMEQADLRPTCHLHRKSMANGLRDLYLGNASWTVAGARSAKRFEQKFEVTFERLATIRSPNFAYFAHPNDAQTWLNHFKGLETDQVLASNQIPIRAWKPEVLERYVALER